MRSLASLAIAGVLTFSLAACADDDGGGHGGEGSCSQLSSTCHDVDHGDGFVAECHALGHDGTAAECDAMLEACLAACRAAADGGAHHEDHDAGAHDDG